MKKDRDNDTVIKCWDRARAQTAQTVTEYALIVAAIAVAVLSAYNGFGGQLTTVVSNIAAAL